MPKITSEAAYNGALERIKRLGLDPLLDQVRSILTGFDLLVKEERDTNGGAAVRKMIDAQFVEAGGWTKKQTGIVIALCHDGPGPPLAKQAKKRMK